MKVIQMMIGAVLLGGSITLANADSAKEAEKLLESMNMASVLEQSMAQMLDVQIQQNPSLAPFRDVMQEFLDKHISYASMKDDLIEVYSSHFSVEELQEINAFYATDVGRKTIQKMPELMAQGAQIGAMRVQENLPELQAMIQAEEERLQSQQ